MDEDEEIKGKLFLLGIYSIGQFFEILRNVGVSDLLKRKTKLSKDSHKLVELGDVVYRIGYLHYNKGKILKRVFSK